MCDEIAQDVGACFAMLLLPDVFYFVSPAMTEAIFSLATSPFDFGRVVNRP